MEKRCGVNPAFVFYASQQMIFCTCISIVFLVSAALLPEAGAASNPQELLRGFTATPEPSVSFFQPILTDSNGNYSFGFLRVDGDLLYLAVVHLPSSEPLWRADMTRIPRWSDDTKMHFDGSLLLEDEKRVVIWSTETNINGDRVWLSNTSNLEIQKLDASPPDILWQSFDFPSDTLMETQKFSSSMSLVASNGLYMMRLGSDFMGLHSKFKKDSGSSYIYWKHSAMEVKAHVVEGQGPLHAILMSDGYLGMYQNGSAPVDMQPFISFQQLVLGRRRVKMEPDGNLKGYYWTGSDWILDYQAISNACQLPNYCGSYGLCQSGKGCSCIDNQTDYDSGGCTLPGINNGGDLCGVNQNQYRILRRNGVEPAYKELMNYSKMDSLDQCESACQVNCTCWGALYTNTTGFCYMLDYPIQTLMGIGDETKVGYFKVWEGARRKKGMEMQLRLGIGLLICGVVLTLGGVVGLVWYKRNKSRKGVSEYLEEEIGHGGGVGPYKDLRSASFKSIELCER